MPELNHKFTLGRMNKDADERLVQNGEYRDALNTQVATSDGSDIGTLQNLLGNIDISHDFINFDPAGTQLGDFEYYCVGSIVDGKTDRIYWMLSGAGKDIIAEYDYTTQVVLPVIVDIYNINVVAGPGSGRVLNFDKNFLITGINIIDDFLFWTDNNTEPKQINIQTAKMGCVNPTSLLPDFNYQTDLYVKTRKPENQVPPFVNVAKMKEEHITVIKKSPKIAPRLEMKNTLRGDHDLDGFIGNIQTTITFNTSTVQGSDPVATLQDSDGEWLTNEIAFQTDSLVDYETGDFLTLTLQGSGGAYTSDQELSEIVIEIKSHIEWNHNYIYLTTAYDSPASVLTDPTKLFIGGVNVPATNIWFRAEIVSGNLTVNSTTNLFDVSLKQEDSVFKFKFPRFATRYKYTDGQYSTFSPFSEVAFLPSKFDYLPKEGYNLGMVNSVRKLAIKDFVNKQQIPEDVVEMDILYKESNSPIVYAVDTIKRVDFNASKYDSWNAININDTSTQNTTGFVRISSEVIHSMIPSNQLLRVYDNVPRKALAQEIVGNRIVYGNYLQNYNMENSSSFSVPALISLGVVSFSRNSNITIDAHLTHTTRSLATSGLAMVPQLLNPLHAKSYSPAKSIKTLRTYQVGVSYIDEFGRETPVFSSSKNSKNSLQVPKSIADQAGSLKAQMFSMRPEWAKNFKFLIKESSNEYYNLAMDRWYPAQDGNIWLSFPSAERNKVDDETFLILKKRHNSDIFVPDNTKYKILAIENEAPLFIKTKKVPKKTVFDTESMPAVPAIPGPPQAAVRLIGTAAAGSNDETTGFPATNGTQIKFYTDDILSLARVIEDEGIINWEFRVRHAVGGTSNWYKIQSFEKDPVGTYTTIVSKKQFGLDMGVTSAIPWGNPTAAGAAFDNIQVEFVRNEVKDLPEFDGRFFVKVLADSTIKKSITGQYAGEDSTAWQVTDAIRSQYINPETDYGNTGIPDQWDNGSVDKWFGSDKNTISIEDMGPSSQGNKMNHAVHDYVTSTSPTHGQTYWNQAGKISASGNASSGWFIDKIEAFRPWKITGGMGWDYDMNNPVTNPNTNGVSNTTRNDNSYFTNQDTGYAQSTYFMGSLCASVNGKGYKQQLKLVGTNTHSSAPNTYLNQADLKPHGTMLRDGDTNTYGGVIPSLGIDKISNGGGDIIHLSYSGVGSDEPLTPLSSLNQLKTRLDDAAWAVSFVDDVSFITAITQQGALWRWAEDPDGIIYRTSGYDPSSMSGTLTQQEWNNNTFDKKDGGLGVGLYNYTSFCDYIVPHLVHYVQEWLFFSPSKIDSKQRSHFVSVGRRDTDKSSLGILAILGADITFAGLLAGALVDLNNSQATSAGGWGGTGNAHYEYPSFTKEWGKARNRRRRYMFAAKPFIDANGKIIDISVNSSTLGNVTNNPDPTTGVSTQTGNYLPTNDPGLTPHFLGDGTLLPRDPALASSASVPVRPSTDAPGIRPDGVYSDFNGTVPAIKTTDAAGAQSEAPGSCTFELVVPFIETDDGDEFTTTNPAIWETEPKKDLDLDLYYEVGQTYPTDLNSTTMEQFVGPIRDYDVLFPKRNFNTKVTCFTPSSMFYSKAEFPLNSGAVYDLTSATAAGDPGLVGSAIPGSDDIRVVSHSIPASNAYCTDGVSLDEATCLAPNLWYDGEDGSDHHVWLEDVNGVPLIGDDASLIMYPGQVVPAQGSFLRFTREDGSTTESKVMSQAQITGPTLDPITGAQLGAVLHNAYELDSNSHNYEVSLPWHNCYSFGNGVESNRVRDDYNQVFIDKGAKVSTVLEEPYLEDRRSSGLIYSGIYNSMSNVNNLNQFIQAEKITKDLNPDGGSIQKLYTRDTNLVTICEDKVFKILASKDALFNADGNPQLVATNKVLGEATTFAGDYGISTNPESFAVDSFRMYFTDRVRGAVIRLSQDGITPISSIGMADWFNDNLVQAKRLVGSFDDKKKEYNLNLGYFDYATYSVDILCDAKTILDPLTGQVISQVFTIVPPGVLVLNGTDASKFSIGDIVNGEGIKPNSVITAIDYQGGGAWWIKLNQTPDLADLWALLPQGQTLPFVYGTYFTFPTRITASVETQPSNTISFSEKNKGWVSFKSFLKEGGLSLNNEYFTFKHGMLNQHHTNPVHNNFYGQQFDSSVEVLFNEIPGSVKSFGALNYEGSQSHITQDLQNSAEYWDNKDKLGWYVSNVYTDLQEGDLHEFKDKENKWFSQLKGVTTKWLDDGMGGNIDTNEFSYQGIDDNSGVTIIDGGYTSWDCYPGGESIRDCTQGEQPVARDVNGNLYRHYDAIAAAAAGNPSLQNPSWINYLWMNSANPGGIALSNGQTSGVWNSGYSIGYTGTFGTGTVYDDNSPSIVMGQSEAKFPCFVNGVDNTDGNYTMHAGTALTGINCDPNGIPYLYAHNFLYLYEYGNSSSAPNCGFANLLTSSGQSVHDAFGAGNLVYKLEYDINGNSIFGPNVDGIIDMMSLAEIDWDQQGDSCRVCGPTRIPPRCIEIPGLSGVYANEQLCLSDPTTACGSLCTYRGTMDTILVHATDSDCALGSVHVNFPVLDPSASFWNVSYTAVNVVNTLAGTIYDDPVTYYFFGDSNSHVLDGGEWMATITDSNGCTVTKDFEILCNYNPPVSCVNNFNSVINVVDATEDGVGNCPQTLADGSIDVTITSISPSATTWSVQYLSLINGILTSIFIDDNFGSGYQINSSSYLGNLDSGDYVVRVSDNADCVADFSVAVLCVAVPIIVCGSGLYDLTNPVNVQPTSPNCNNGAISWDLAISPNYSSNGAPPPTTVTVTFHESITPNIPITTTNYPFTQLPLTISNTGLSAGITYAYTISDNNGCATFRSWSAYTCVASIPGCMDSQSINYDPLATVDNGSCIRPPRINKHRSQHSANCSPSGTYGAYECIGDDLETGWDRVKEVRVNTSATSFTIQYYRYSSTSWPGCPTDININTPIAQQFQLPASATPVGPLQGPFFVSNLNVTQTYGPNVIIESQQGNGPQFHLDLGGMDNLSNNACSGKKYAIEITDNNGLSSAVCIDIGNKPRVTQLNDSGHIAMNAVFQVPMGSGWNWHQYPDSNNPFWHAFAPKATITVTDATGPNCDDGQIEVSNVIVGGCSGNYSVSLVFAPGEIGGQLPCNTYTCWDHPDNVVNVGIPSSSSNSVVFGNLNSTAIMHPLYPGYGQGNYYIQILDNMGNRARYKSWIHHSPGVLLPNGNLIVSC